VKLKNVVLAFFVVALLATLAVPAVSAETQKLALMSAVSKASGETVFTFLIYGELNNFDGTAYHNGQAYDLRCAPRGEKPDVLLCRGAAALGGKTVQVVVSGFSFVTYVEITESPPSLSYCYPVYDINFLSPNVWFDHGDYCTPTQPEYGDMAWLAGYYLGPIVRPYMFLLDGMLPGINQFGSGWYWHSDLAN
jgi:hypothetical protein